MKKYKIKYLGGSLDITAGKSFGRMLKECHFCGKVTPRWCSIDGEKWNGFGRKIRVCRGCQKELGK